MFKGNMTPHRFVTGLALRDSMLLWWNAVNSTSRRDCDVFVFVFCALTIKDLSRFYYYSWQSVGISFRVFKPFNFFFFFWYSSQIPETRAWEKTILKQTCVFLCKHNMKTDLGTRPPLPTPPSFFSAEQPAVMSTHVLRRPFNDFFLRLTWYWT